MAKNFAEIAFTPEVRKLQEKMGSRASYARMERDTWQDGLTESEAEFISQRDSFYMASIGENGFPYIQHRGGPKGFIKVLDAKNLGFIDFKGNMQFITVGNLATNNNVSLIMVDYPAKTRLKIYARARIAELKDELQLFKLLDLENYKFRPERMMVLQVEAYDWNCPKHITTRYTEGEIMELFANQMNRIDELQNQIAELKLKLKS
ncbi:MAG: pyridoxamine 5'-phosphate oxidase family protein [Taibaiella sp.]|nr:pyridoxamine 5'-phosphate oxidase family protein [Taibaiella sp.]